MRIKSAGLMLVLALGGLSGCVARVSVREPVGEVVVHRPPPPLQAESVPPPPGDPNVFIWQPGHWKWDGRDYAWHPGHYEKRPARSAFWVPPEWVARGDQWVYKPGHWAYR